MSPKIADPALRTALIDAAARLIAEGGSDGLSLRRLAGRVGTSTMAIYTHFGGMDEVRRAVRDEGFARLAAHLAAIDESDDPVADLIRLGGAYYRNAVTNPNLYLAMFMEHPVDSADAGVGIETFLQLVTCVERCVRAGRFADADPVGLATQIWASSHGIITLHLAGIPPFEAAAEALGILGAVSVNLIKAFGDDPAAIARSIARAGPGAFVDKARSGEL